MIAALTMLDDRPPVRRRLLRLAARAARRCSTSTSPTSSSPALYLIVFLAAAGAISEILPTFARKPLFSHRAVAGLVRRDRRPRPARLDAEHVHRPAQRGLDDRRDGSSRSRSSSRSGRCSTTGSRRSGTARSSCARRPGTRCWRSRRWPSGSPASSSYSVIPVGWALDNTTAEPGRHALRARRRRRDRRLRGPALLVPEDQRAPARRGPRQGRPGADDGRHPPLRDPDVPRRARGPAGRRLQVTTRTPGSTATT